MAKHIHVHESISGKNVVTTRWWITHSHRQTFNRWVSVDISTGNCNILYCVHDESLYLLIKYITYFKSRIALNYLFLFFFYLLHFLFFLYEHSYGIVERTDIRMGRQFKWADGSAGWRRQRGSEDTAVSQGLDCWPGPSRYMYQLINIGCLVHGHQ